MDLLSELTLTVADGLQSQSLTNCLRWACQASHHDGRLRGSLLSHRSSVGQRDARLKASFNYAMKSAQAGVTEVAINRAFYVLDKLRRDVLYVLPTALNASDFSKARFATALR